MSERETIGMTVTVFLIVMMVLGLYWALVLEPRWRMERVLEELTERLTLELPFLSRLPMLEAQGNKIHFNKVKPMIEALEREGKSLTAYVKSEEDKQACLNDLDKIIKCAEIEISIESKANAENTNHQRKNDFERFIPLAESQKGKVKVWRGHIHYAEQITFETLEGGAEITRSGEDEATAFAFMLPAGSYRVTVQKDGHDVMSEESGGEDRYDFVKAGIGAIRNGEAIIEDLQNGQRERVPFW